MNRLSHVFVMISTLAFATGALALEPNAYYLDRGNSSRSQILAPFTLKDLSGLEVHFNPGDRPLNGLSLASRAGLILDKSFLRLSGNHSFDFALGRIDPTRSYQSESHPLILGPESTGQNVILRLVEYFPEVEDDLVYLPYPYNVSGTVTQPCEIVLSSETVCVDDVCHKIERRLSGTKTITITMDDGESGNGVRVDLLDPQTQSLLAVSYLKDNTARPRSRDISTGPCVAN